MNLSQAALNLYKPPFKVSHGYVFDANNEMVADDVGANVDNHVLEVRGWGRISQLPRPEALQDAVADHIAAALNEYWERHNGKR